MSECPFCNFDGEHSVEKCRDRLYILHLRAIDFIKRSGARIDTVNERLEQAIELQGTITGKRGKENE